MCCTHTRARAQVPLLACPLVTPAALRCVCVQAGAASGAAGEAESTEIIDSDEEEDDAEQAAEEAEIVAQAGTAASAGMSRSDAAV